MEEEASEKESNTSTTTPSEDSTIERQRTTNPSLCRVCGAPALYSYYGAVVCRCCKVFFKRNAHKTPEQLKCHYDGHCEIDINNRRICPFCRVTKCIAVGMKADLIRSSWTTQTKTKRQERTTTSSTSTAVVRRSEQNQLSHIPTSNLLQVDRSTLSVDQWNELSDLVRCFDEYSGSSFSQHFIDEQNALPPKLRFKHTSVNHFFTTMMTKVQTVFEKSRNLLSLPIQDRSTLLRHTVEYTTVLGVAFILRQVHLFDLPTFDESAKLIFRPSSVAFFKRLVDQLDPDPTFMKISLVLIAFSLSNNTDYSSTPSTNVTNATAVMRAQNMYAELVWGYLLYKHSFREAVLCFSNFVRCLLLLNNSVVEAHEAREFTDIIDSVVESTEQKLTLEN